jgi:hypothetical protein
MARAPHLSLTHVALFQTSGKLSRAWGPTDCTGVRWFAVLCGRSHLPGLPTAFDLCPETAWRGSKMKGGLLAAMHSDSQFHRALGPRDEPRQPHKALDAATADTDAAELKVLVIAIEDSALAARISMALASVGCSVASLAPRRSRLCRCAPTRGHYWKRKGGRS